MRAISQETGNMMVPSSESTEERCVDIKMVTTPPRRRSEEPIVSTPPSKKKRTVEQSEEEEPFSPPRIFRVNKFVHHDFFPSTKPSMQGLRNNKKDEFLLLPTLGDENRDIHQHQGMVLSEENNNGHDNHEEGAIPAVAVLESPPQQSRGQGHEVKQSPREVDCPPEQLFPLYRENVVTLEPRGTTSLSQYVVEGPISRAHASTASLGDELTEVSSSDEMVPITSFMGPCLTPTTSNVVTSPHRVMSIARERRLKKKQRQLLGWEGRSINDGNDDDESSILSIDSKKRIGLPKFRVNHDDPAFLQARTPTPTTPPPLRRRELSLGFMRNDYEQPAPARIRYRAALESFLDMVSSVCAVDTTVPLGRNRPRTPTSTNQESSSMERKGTFEACDFGTAR